MWFATSSRAATRAPTRIHSSLLTPLLAFSPYLLYIEQSKLQADLNLEEACGAMLFFLSTDCEQGTLKY